VTFRFAAKTVRLNQTPSDYQRSSFGVLRYSLHCLSIELLDNPSRLAAQQRDVALAVDAGQIHPYPKLPRPNFAERIVRMTANCDQRSVACGELFD
jgi:hypothetical protein